ncbi:MAG: hypothetical protein ACR2G5_12265 [Pyrinomonadaceae bacterium]
MIDLSPVAQTLKKMKHIEAELGTALIERSEVIRAILLALLSHRESQRNRLCDWRSETALELSACPVKRQLCAVTPMRRY